MTDLITTPEGEWLERDLRTRLAMDVADIREELAELQERFETVMRDVRSIPGGEFLWQRVDAYPGTRLDRDMGSGQDADGWLAEVAEFLEVELIEPEDPNCPCGGFADRGHRDDCPATR